MFSRQFHRQLTAWLAAWAVLLGSLLPVLSHAVVAHTAGENGWVEVCTVSGMAWVRQADDASASASNSQTPQPGDAGGTLAGMGSCDWCATHAPITGLPSLNAVAHLPALALPAFPPAFLQTPRTPSVWATAQTRGPPALA
jgi:hypothetical protein